MRRAATNELRTLRYVVCQVRQRARVRWSTTDVNQARRPAVLLYTVTVASFSLIFYDCFVAYSNLSQLNCWLSWVELRSVFHCAFNFYTLLFVFPLLPPTNEEVNVLPAFVCLSVYLLARLLKNACMDLDEMLRDDRCRDMDELINFIARFGL